MKFLKSVRYQTLYILWAVLFAASAVLGLLFPAAEGGAKAALMILSAVFFLPPWLILAKANHSGSAHHRRLIRLLAVLALVLATVMICVSILAANSSDGVNAALHVVMTIVTAPMICSNYYVLPLFLWATLLIGSFAKKK